MQRLQRAFAGVDAAAGELELAAAARLLGHEHVAAVADHRVGAGAVAVGLRGVDRLAIASHGGTLGGGAGGRASPGLHSRRERLFLGPVLRETFMTLAGRIAWDDTILPFQLDRADIRGRVGRLDSVLETILGQHDYPAPVAALVAEAALITALIGQTIKPRWKLSLQVRGDGPVRLIATDYFGPSAEGEPAKMRAYAGFDAERVAAASVARPFDLLGKGVFAILIDQGPGTAPYQGMTPITGDSLADCAETYFAQSEQLPTRFALAMGEALEPGGAAHWRGGGVLLQHMPKASPHAKQEATGSTGCWRPRTCWTGTTPTTGAAR